MSRPPCVKCGQAQAVRPGKLCNKCFAEQGLVVKKNIERLKLGQLRFDERLQMRVKFNDEAAKDYADAYEKGVDLPELIVFRDKAGVNWVADGFHRGKGALWARVEDAPCEVRKGEFEDAWLFSIGANEQHGIRRTAADRRNAVKALLADQKYQGQSKRWIAETANVSFYLVSQIVKEIEDESKPKPEPEEEELDRDGPSPLDDQPQVKPSPKEYESSARSSATEKVKPERKVDAVGVVIPDKLLDVFFDDALPEASMKLEEMVNVLHDSKKLLTRLYARAAQYPFLDLNIASTGIANARCHLLQAAEALKSAMPHVVCQACRGNGCARCGQSGYLPKWKHDEAKEYGDDHADAA